MLLIGAGYTHYLFLQRDLTQQTKVKFDSYLQQYELEIYNILIDTHFLSNLLDILNPDNLDDKNDIERLINLSHKPYTLFIYEEGDLRFWSNDKAHQPDPAEIEADNPYFNDQNGNYYRILAEEVFLAERRYLVAASIPIRLTSRDNPYGHIDRNIPANVQLSSNPGIPIVTSQDQEFLYISPFEENELTRQEVKILLSLYGLAMIALIVLIQRIAIIIKERVGIWESFGFLIFTAVGIRVVSILFNLTSQFSAVEAFDTGLMEPAFTNSSLADILINIGLLLWISIFIINNLVIKEKMNTSLWRQIPIVLGSYLSIAIGLILLAKLCQLLIQDTSIDFNFESVFNLDRISILSLVGIILVLFTQFVWSAKLVSIVQDLGISLKHKIIAGSVALALSTPILFFICRSVPIIPFVLVAGIFILLLDIFLEVKTPNFTWVVLWLVVLSGFSSILLFKFNRDKDIEIRTKIAESLTERIDTLALKEIINVLTIVSDPLLQVRSRYQVRNTIASGVAQGSSYLTSHYQIQFPEADALNGSEEFQWNGLTFYKKVDVLDHYFITVEGGGGTKVMTAFSKQKHNPYSPLPSLIPETNFKGNDILNEYEYAIYKEMRCVERSSSGYKMVLEEIEPPVGEFRLVYPAGRSELIYNNGEYTTMVGKKLAGLIKPVSLVFIPIRYHRFNDLEPTGPKFLISIFAN